MTEERKIELRDNYMRLMERIENAKAKRDHAFTHEVTLLAASKQMPGEDVEFLARECGLKLCGENHVQEFREKYELVTGAGCRMDVIGHLQTNKVKYVVGKAGLIHSVDSLRVAEAIERQAERLGVIQDVLVEVNIGEEESKTGLTSAMVPEIVAAIEEMKHVNLSGMMAMTPICVEMSDFHKYFRESLRIFLDFFEKKPHNIGEGILSMGMSDSFEAAILEGASVVRVGSCLFGHRKY